MKSRTRNSRSHHRPLKTGLLASLLAMMPFGVGCAQLQAMAAQLQGGAANCPIAGGALGAGNCPAAGVGNTGTTAVNGIPTGTATGTTTVTATPTPAATPTSTVTPVTPPTTPGTTTPVTPAPTASIGTATASVPSGGLSSGDQPPTS